MWQKPWSFGEGAVIGVGLLTMGILMQLTIGPIDWHLLSSPVNIILLSIYVLALGVSYILRKRLYVVQWSMTMHAAVPALLSGVAVTLWLGLTGWDDTLQSWPFVLIYIWLMNIAGLVGTDRIFRLVKSLCQGKPWRNTLFLLASVLNHIGLFVAMVCGTLGYADMQRLHMTVKVGTPEWRATNADSNETRFTELPLAIELHSFTIEEYAPQYSIIDNETGTVVQDSPWQLRQDSLYDYAAPRPESDSYVSWHSMGACTAAYIIAYNIHHVATEDWPADGEQQDSVRSGWVSCGSFMFPYKALRLDDRYSAVMPQREPKRFVSEVTVYTEAGNKQEAVIEVNHPFEIAGWKIYQLSYDEALGRWSDTSVFELVRDPWLPYVYSGIFMMLAGAALLFLTNNRVETKNREREL